MKTNHQELKRLNDVLRTIRNVNQLLAREKDRGRLLQGICDNLVENRGYYNAWIALLDDAKRLITAAESGLGERFLQVQERLEDGLLTMCAVEALKQSGVFITQDPFSACTDCPLSANYAGRGSMAVRIEHDGVVYGVLSTSIPAEFTVSSEEKSLLEEVAGDIAFGLNNIEKEEAQRKTVHNLQERVKELNCLFGISKLLEKRPITLETIFQGTVDLIPPAWQYPELTGARILLEGQEFKTSNFAQTKWKQVEDIFVNGEPKGILEVCYSGERAEDEEGPFSREERDLLEAIAERLGKVTERMRAQKALKETEQRFRDLVENLPVGVAIHRGDRIVYQNPEQGALMGPLPRKSLVRDMESVHPEDVHKVKQLYSTVRPGRVQTLEADFRFFPSDKPPNRHDMKWVHCRTATIKYEGEEAMLVIMMDVTRAKELEESLRVQDKMSSLGRVAAGIAHEIRNPLSGINIYLNTLEKMYRKGETTGRVEDILNQMQSASNKIESVIRRVMDFSKPTEPKSVLVDINDPIREAIKLSSVSLRKKGVNLINSLATGLPPCFLDPNMFEQAILNLITNAADAMKDIDRAKEIEIKSFLANNKIFVTVSDSGSGVPLALRDRVFDPFYTTKNGSTGIGLSIVHRIITDHRGSLELTLSKRGGAEFRIELPTEKGEGPK